MSDVKNSSLATDLVSYWELEESTGTRVDSHGTYDATDVGSVGSATGIQGDGASFTGATNQELNAGDITELTSTGAFSISCWFAQDVLDVRGAIFTKGVNGSGASISVYSFTDGNLYIEYNGGSIRARFDYSTVVTAGTLAHMVMVFNGGGANNAARLKVYIDGSEQTLTYFGTIGTTTGANTNDFIIGGNTVSSYNFDGIIDEFGIWERALSSSDVSSLYNGGVGIPYEDTGGGFVKPNYVGFSRI